MNYFTNPPKGTTDSDKLAIMLAVLHVSGIISEDERNNGIDRLSDYEQEQYEIDGGVNG